MRKICMLLLVVLILLTGFPTSLDNVAEAAKPETGFKEYNIGPEKKP